MTLVIAAGFAIPSNAYSSQSAKLFSLLASEGGSLQGYIDNVLSPEAGNSVSDWMFIDLMRHDTSLNGEKYVASLDAFFSENTPTNNTEKERVAIAYTAAGIRNDFVNSTLECDFSATGINGLAFGLILLDCGKYESKSNDRNALINDILEMQFSDNGWALSGAVSDIDITAMVLQALAPYKNRSNVASAIDKALEFLSEKQTGDGDYKGMGKPPMPTCESTAQVIIALTSLGINPATDSRFIKNGNSVYDGLRRYQLNDGSYCHMATYASRNAIATEQAARALTAAERFATGKASFYSFEKRPSTEVTDPPVVPDKPDENTSSTSAEDKTSSSSEDESSSSSEESSESSDDTSESSDSYSSYTASSEYTSEERGDEPEVIGTSGKKAYKFYACGGILLMFAFACVYLRIRQRATLKNIIPIAIGAIMLICGVLFFNFTSVNDYYNVNLDSASNGDSSVTISINCKILEGVADNVPEEGYILKPTKYVIKEGDTVFDALLAVTRANKIKISYTGSGGLISVYVSSIGGYTEMQYGALSGWIYRVNKYTPDVGCGSYDLNDGDVIEWVYTLDLGKDVDRYD